MEPVAECQIAANSPLYVASLCQANTIRCGAFPAGCDCATGSMALVFYDATGHRCGGYHFYITCPIVTNLYIRYACVKCRAEGATMAIQATMADGTQVVWRDSKRYLWIVGATVSYTHLRAHETDSYLVCRLLLEKTKKT